MDTTSAVFYVHCWGRTRSLQSLREAQRVWTWAHPWRTSLRAIHPVGRRNSVADCLSAQKLEGSSRGMEAASSQSTTHCPLLFSLALPDEVYAQKLKGKALSEELDLALNDMTTL
ncbi:hypothetical protein GOODEAATRI_024292 [Goodea atripinnis]|uniref:Uncharacterized protein n=1 Tax=Goodea atripinnis TaxID=208336 RepID=A0ABV0P7E9_9TELE